MTPRRDEAFETHGAEVYELDARGAFGDAYALIPLLHNECPRCFESSDTQNWGFPGAAQCRRTHCK